MDPKYRAIFTFKPNVLYKINIYPFHVFHSPEWERERRLTGKSSWQRLAASVVTVCKSMGLFLDRPYQYPGYL